MGNREPKPHKIFVRSSDGDNSYINIFLFTHVESNVQRKSSLKWKQTSGYDMYKLSYVFLYLYKYITNHTGCLNHT